MYSLFKVKFYWGFYFLLLICLRVIWIDLSWFSFTALAITLYQFLLLFYSVGSVLPIRYLAGSFMCLQMLLGPTFAYNGLDMYQRLETQMKVSESEYFIYAIPAVILFIAGLHIRAGKLKGEVLNLPAIREFIYQSGNLPYIFIIVGFLCSYVSGVFGPGLDFVFYLLSGFKFIGTFMLVLGTRKVKGWVLVLVFGSIIASSLQKAMFHDLLTWLIMLGAVLAIKYKPSLILKAVVALAFVSLAVVIQQIKTEYRQAAYTGSGSGAGLESFQDAVQEDEDVSNSKFSKESLAKSNIRINQGYIITNIMQTVPDRMPYENGTQLLEILEAAFMPRFLAPDKLNAGDRFIFMKYTGLTLQKGTSMALSSLGDAYINFGIIGGSIFMFFLGLLFSEVLNGFYNFSKMFPFLILFTTLVFYYPIRPDCELQTSLGHLVKSCVIIYLMLIFWKYQVKKRKPGTGKIPVHA